MTETVLVTGGAGYIGSHACAALARAGYTPVAFDNLVTGWEAAVKFGPFEAGDLRDRDRLDAVLATHRPVAVMHFAALSNVGQATLEPARYWDNNVIGTLRLLEAIAAAGIPHLVFSSTCATYGDQDGVVLDEHCQQQPLNAYGATKLAAEQMIGNFTDRPGSTLEAVMFRYFNVAGAEASAGIGEYHRPETHLIPLALDAVLGRRETLTVFGRDYPTPDGTCIRDYVHVSDLVDAHMAGLEHLRAGKGPEVVNLGTGSGFSVQDVLEAVAEVTGIPVPVVDGTRRDGDCAALVSGSARAADILDWRPDRSTLPQMIASAWDWHRGNGYGS